MRVTLLLGPIHARAAAQCARVSFPPARASAVLVRNPFAPDQVLAIPRALASGRMARPSSSFTVVEDAAVLSARDGAPGGLGMPAHTGCPRSSRQAHVNESRAGRLDVDAN
mmetsp:Transcript_18361/g.45318  ORF Transcript_18361/g.45318 Transcript_18361/m.45318 type:complete len:111 (-) Transcript_18361:933-1265(-)